MLHEEINNKAHEKGLTIEQNNVGFSVKKGGEQIKFFFKEEELAAFVEKYDEKNIQNALNQKKEPIVRGQSYARKNQMHSNSNSPDQQQIVSRREHITDTANLVMLFYVLSGLSLLGGVVLAAQFWPSDLGYSKELKSVAYTWSIVWLIAGITQAAIFAAIAKILSLLQQIADNKAA